MKQYSYFKIYCSEYKYNKKTKTHVASKKVVAIQLIPLRLLEFPVEIAQPVLHVGCTKVS